MKKTIRLTILLMILQVGAYAQERYGNTLNLGLGIGYYGYGSMPVIHANYEFDAAKNFTLAPFISLYSYRNDYYWGSSTNPYRYYGYRETVIPVGVKGTYYFDELFDADSQWDFYGAGSLGFAIRTITWDSDYNGNRDISRRASPLYLDLHIGAEYHLNNRIGLFLDLSTGVSTVGLAIR